MREFSLKDSCFEVPSTLGLSFCWANLCDQELASQVCFQEQFLRFFRYMLENLQSRECGKNWQQPLPLSLSLRAGAIKFYVLSVASLAEAVLASVAETRKYTKLPKEVHHRTFGKVLEAWKYSGAPQRDIAPFWDDLQLIKKYRDYVHLGRASVEPDSYWQDINASERSILSACDRVMQCLAAICDSPS